MNVLSKVKLLWGVHLLCCYIILFYASICLLQLDLKTFNFYLHTYIFYLCILGYFKVRHLRWHNNSCSVYKNLYSCNFSGFYYILYFRLPISTYILYSKISYLYSLDSWQHFVILLIFWFAFFISIFLIVENEELINI